MNDNRTLLTTNVTDGRTSITSDPGGAIDAVTACTVIDGNIKSSTWQPYEYHFYQLKASDTGTDKLLQLPVVRFGFF